MADGQVYNIPAERFSWFKDQLEKLGRKAKKLNGEKLYVMAVGFHNEEDQSSRWHGKKIMEVFVACPEPKLDGWEFVARIDHGNDIGNIVRTTGLRDLPEDYRNSKPHCDHCQHKRQRRDTFVVYHEEHGFKQVGSSCLKDFLGHGDADRIAKLAELLASVHGFMRQSFDDQGNLQNHRGVILDGYLGVVAETILKYGFVSKKQAWEENRESTADKALTLYYRVKPVSPEAKELATKAREWAENLDETETQELSDYLHNAWVVANSPAIELRATGIAASIVGVYYRNNKPVTPVSNQHIGIVGEKLEIELKIMSTRILDSGSTLVDMRDLAGNVVKWFATKNDISQFVGQTLKLRVTVKKHDNFRGQLQTLVTRCQRV